MTLPRLLLLCFASLVTIVQAGIFQSVNIASSASIRSSSVDTTGKCAGNKCGAEKVIKTNGTNDDGSHWFSVPGSCDPLRNESLTLDWTFSLGVQLLSEVRFRYGTLQAGASELVIYSDAPLNVAVPTAVTYIDNIQWHVFVFTEPVTATGFQLFWSQLTTNREDGLCFVEIWEVEAYTGVTPDVLPPLDSSNPPSKSGPSAGVIAAIVVIPIIVLTILGGLWIVRTRRANLLKLRLAREIELRRTQAGGLGNASAGAGRPATHDDDTSSIVGLTGKNQYSPRTTNFLNSQRNFVQLEDAGSRA
ncbi:hypothetical protein HDU76_010626 [Blyttiomyces sp. JEL0837]|nr:hypothetical protein HDU76_010626 [Blyttiomyces sp. JEL0837]